MFSEHTLLTLYLHQMFQKGKGEFCEDLLGLTQLHCHTKGEDISEAITQMLMKAELTSRLLSPVQQTMPSYDP